MFVFKNNGSMNNHDIMRLWKVLSLQIPGKFLLFNQEKFDIVISTLYLY